MPHHRYYLDAPLQENKTVVLSEDEFHHLSRVSRARRGDFVEVINGRGQLAKAIVTELNKRNAALLIDRVDEEVSQKTPLILAQALTRMNHLEWIVEKGTELNVTTFWLFPGILSEKECLSETQSTRLKTLTISAMKQCGRLDLPSIEFKTPLLKWASLQGTLFFGDTSEEALNLWELSPIKPLFGPVVILIGPESGFDPRERIFLLNSLSAKGVRLHPNILRVETASLVALSLIQQYL
jgi:16S rRNA (uracil1498-N3)-methyltransferase